MKKIIALSMVAGSVLFADIATGMVKDVAVAKVKEQAKDAAIKQVAGNDPVKQEMAQKVADKVVGEPSTADKVKGAVADKVMGGGSDDVVGDATKAVSGAGAATAGSSSMKDKAVDMAVDKAVGSDPMKKQVAQKAIDAVVK